MSATKPELERFVSNRAADDVTHVLLGSYAQTPSLVPAHGDRRP